MFDALCALTVMLVTFTTLNGGQMPGEIQEFLTARLSVKNFAVAILLVAIWSGCFAAFGLYQVKLVRGFSAAAMRIVLACSVATLFVSPFTLASSSGSFGLQEILLFWLGAVVAELCGRAGLSAGAWLLEQRTREERVVLIVGSGPRAMSLWRTLERTELREQVVAGFVDTRDMADVLPPLRPRMLGTLDQLEFLLSRKPVDEVLIALPIRSHYTEIQQVLDTCERLGVQVKYPHDLFAVSRARHEVDRDDELPGIRLHQVASDSRLVVKRAIDLLGAAGGLIVLSPVLLACAIAIKLTSRGPIVFSQERCGYNRRVFRMFKFRTMVDNAEQLQASLESQNEAAGPVFKIRADPRITPIGGFLRRTSLDELPQLFNVLRGDMSLVGPRPLALRDVKRFDAAWLMRRFSVKPGLTCLWQITGRSNTSFDQWVQLDLDYIDNWSLSLDARILIRTVPVVISGSGAM